jgi:hypothetical protein
MSLVLLCCNMCNVLYVPVCLLINVLSSVVYLGCKVRREPKSHFSNASSFSTLTRLTSEENHFLSVLYYIVCIRKGAEK